MASKRQTVKASAVLVTPYLDGAPEPRELARRGARIEKVRGLDACDLAEALGIGVGMGASTSDVETPARARAIIARYPRKALRFEVCVAVTFAT